jgi:RNA polymerase sigma factor (TIGR02999 family)
MRQRHPQMSGSSTPPLGGAAVAPEERRALDAAFSAAYEELRRLASAVKSGDRRCSLTPTGLVNEAWMKLAGSPGVAGTSRVHFKRIAGRAMRQVLVEAARRRGASKRGGDDPAPVPLDESLDVAAAPGEDVLALDEALEALADVSPRQAMLVESRFFGGLDVAETAALLGVSESTILREWRAARAWLAREMRRAG